MKAKRTQGKTMKFIILLILLVVPELSFALNTVATGYQIPTGGSPVTINAHGVCRVVRNNRSEAVFVPTKTASEWTSFRSNPLPSMTLANCCLGFSYAGFCYHRGAPGQTCTQVCSSREGCVAGGLTYIGSSGTVARCKAVLDGLGAPIMNDVVNDGNYSAPYNAMGCSLVDYPGYQFVRIRMLGATTTCASGSPSYERICSCNQ